MDELEKEIFKNVKTYVKVEKGGINIQEVHNFFQAEEIKDKEPAANLPLTDAELMAKIERVRQKITTKRLWFPVCKYMMWRKMVADGDFTAAVKKLDELMPGLKLDAHDLSKMNVQSFRKTLDKWDADDAPVANSTFTKYIVIAEMMDL